MIQIRQDINLDTVWDVMGKIARFVHDNSHHPETFEFKNDLFGEITIHVDGAVVARAKKVDERGWMIEVEEELDALMKTVMQALQAMRSELQSD